MDSIGTRLALRAATGRVHVPHLHRFTIPVLPDGGPIGADLLSVLAMTGRAVYACRCGKRVAR